MKIALFYQSAISDWNHGNAHFLRGIASELISRGHIVKIYEPADSWCMENLIRDHGENVIWKFHSRFPHLNIFRYRLAALELEKILSDFDLAIVHEWNSRELVRKIGLVRASTGKFRLLFHDTHHRLITDPAEMAKYDLSNYDGVLAFGKVLRDLYLERGLTQRAWTWHEAADTRIFRPLARKKPEGDLVWIGNWGDGERTREVQEFFIEPVMNLKLKAGMYGVRYPAHALKALHKSGIEYSGWIPNYEVPEVFARFRATVHIPRGPYTSALPGIPTIRPFEALACGIPLISAPWEDTEGLFREGIDYLPAKNAKEMKKHLKSVLQDKERAYELSRNGRQTILERHTCAHRVTELFTICNELGIEDEKSITPPLRKEARAHV